MENDGTGLLFTGTIGVGKTHLASALLRELIVARGAKGLFYDYRDLLKRIQRSYNSQGESESDILEPVFETEILVIDELGAMKPTEWVSDTIAHILNTRYNNRQVTILTSNYANLAAGSRPNDSAIALAAHANREETLGDRIGERIRSRLQEMCVHVAMEGMDFRQTVRRALLP